MNNYPYIKSLSFNGSTATLTYIDGTTQQLSSKELALLINNLTEDIWFYQERCHELHQEVNEWIYSYEHLSESI